MNWRQKHKWSVGEGGGQQQQEKKKEKSVCVFENGGYVPNSAILKIPTTREKKKHTPQQIKLSRWVKNRRKKSVKKKNAAKTLFENMRRGTSQEKSSTTITKRGE